jgi:hypothetical protein
MNKPRQTKRQVMKFVQIPRLKVRMEFVLDFDRTVSMLTARETARKLLDHMQIVVDGYEPPEELGEITLRTSELKRVIRVQTKATE